jgi:hypothetical protein
MFEHPKMNNRLMFRPNLVDCTLEERVAPAIANLAIIILTTNGLTLIEAFPGANSSGAGSLGATSSGGGSAASVSGTAVPTSLYITGTGGISSLKPGNITGVPSLAGAVVGAAGAGMSIQVGSGADSAGGPTNNVSNGGATNNPVGLATVADPTARPAMTIIGGTSAGSSSPVLPPGQSYRDSAPVQAAPGLTTVPQSATSGPGMSTDPYAPNPQLGAPTLGPFNMNRGGAMANPIPGSLVPVTPLLPGNN